MNRTLREVFCLRDQRYVSKDLTLKYDRKRIKLEINDLTRALVGKYVDIHEYGCGRIQVRAKGVALPHTILNPERRITHAAITENKRLGAVPEYIKAEQDKVPPKVQVKPESARHGYKKTGKRLTGRPSKSSPIMLESALSVIPAQPARAPISEVYTLSGCAIVSAFDDISGLRSR